MLDKVLKAWECCDPFNRRCFECPYEDDCFHDNFDRVAIADMVKLLKEQQPRVLAKTEIADFIDNIVWYETKDQDNSSDYFALVEDYTLKHEAVWLQLISCDRNNRLSTADYGINWRVWSARPTDEQRKAVPWKDW